MVVEPARRLSSLEGTRLVFLDCGKRGGGALLRGIADRLALEGASIAFAEKKSAHRMASRKLIEGICSEFDGVVHGVVD